MAGIGAGFLPLKILFDTHAFFWIVSDDPRLSAAARKIFARSDSEIILSVASIWEILLKAQTGKFPFPRPADAYIRAQIKKSSITVLPIRLEHVFRLEQLALHHRDPFDRIILAQALEENIPIVSADSKFRLYPVEVLW